jgi:uncharacterized protein HemX
MATEPTGAQKSTRTTRGTAPATPVAAADSAAEATETTGVDIAQALTDAAHTVIGFGVIGWTKTQVRRRELLKEINAQRHQVETQLDGAKEQLAIAIRHLDARIEPVRHDIDSQLDKVSERLPEQVREVLESARKIVRETEHQVRQAVGAL